MKKALLSVFLLATCLTASATSSCDQFLPYGYPKPTFSTTALCRIAYFQFHNNEHKAGGLAVQLLTPDTVSTTTVPRTNNFRPDPQVPTAFRSHNADYARTGFDQGHLAPAGDMDGVSMSQSFYLSNIAPQYPIHNRGIWRGLEIVVRNWVVRDSKNLYVMTGTIYSKNPTPSIGPAEVGVPDAFYKVIINKEKQDVIAFVVPHKQLGLEKLYKYQVGLGDVQKIVGFDLIPGADPATKQRLLSADGHTFTLKRK